MLVYLVGARGDRAPVEGHRPQRKLTTILSADVAGYSRMMREDEEGTYRALQSCRREIDRVAEDHQGRIFGSAGDSIVAEFASPVEAVRCAIDIQNLLETQNADRPENRRMRFRIGINLGDVIVEEQNLMGDGVNVAARLQTMAEPGEICISSTIFEQVRSKLPLNCTDLGAQAVKNIATPVHVYRVRPRPQTTPAQVARSMRSWRGAAIAGAILLLVIAGAAITLRLISQAPTRPDQHGGTQRIAIAVLPFANLSADAAQDYFIDGVTEDIIAALGRFSGPFGPAFGRFSPGLPFGRFS